MKENFDICLEVVLDHEGGWSDHPHDPGGATYKGITLNTLRRWWTGKGRAGRPSKDDLRRLDDGLIARIYRDDYWEAIKADQLPGGVDLLAFDSAVNQGVNRASTLLQQAAGTSVDGIIRANSLRAIRAAHKANPRGFLAEVAARRMRHYGGLSTFSTFGLGWSRRLMDVATRAAIL